MVSKRTREEKKQCYVTVLCKDGTPASPTTRGCRVRHLLKQGMAEVVRTRPFTIRLLYETGTVEKSETIGIDPGRTNIGIASVKADGTCTLKEHVTTRNKEIPGLMKSRASSRRKHRDMGRRDVRQRRARKAHTTVSGEKKDRLLPGYSKPITCQDIRNKKARFNNRKRKAGWLTPTARQLLQTHLAVIDHAVKQRPVGTIVLELNRFAFMAMDSPDIKKTEYARGALYGFAGLQEAVSVQQECHCLMCRNEIEQFHHIVPQSKGGSNTIANIAGLCAKCHDKVHKDPAFANKLKTRKGGLNKKYGSLSVLNQIIPFLLKELVSRYPDIEVRITAGTITKQFRENRGIPKDHDNDAYGIACSALEAKEIRTQNASHVETQEIMQFRRQDRMACHKEMTDRKYTDGTGKVVCKNRHKAIEQTDDSLEEYRQIHTPYEVSTLKVKEHKPQYKDPKRVMPGAVIRYTAKLTKRQREAKKTGSQTVFVLKRTDGKHDGKPDYFVDVNGNKYPSGRCEVMRQNIGLVYL